MTPQYNRKPAEILPLTYISGIFREPTANLPLTYRKPSDNHPSPYRGSSLGSLPHGGTSPHQAARVWFVLSCDDLRARPTREQAGDEARRLGVRLDWAEWYWRTMG